MYLGVHMRASPLTVLNQATDLLEARLLRDSLKIQNSSDMEDNGDDVLFSDDDLPERQTFARLKGIGKSKVAPIIRVPNGPPGVLKSKKQSENNFEIYVDTTEVETEIPKDTPNFKEIRLADELASDPDYQASL